MLLKAKQLRETHRLTHILQQVVMQRGCRSLDKHVAIVGHPEVHTGCLYCSGVAVALARTTGGVWHGERLQIIQRGSPGTPTAAVTDRNLAYALQAAERSDLTGGGSPSCRCEAVEEGTWKCQHLSDPDKTSGSGDLAAHKLLRSCQNLLVPFSLRPLP